MKSSLAALSSHPIPRAALTAGMAFLLAAGLGACQGSTGENVAETPPEKGAAAQAAASPAEDLVARGEYLVATMACNDCHTPWKMGEQGPEPDMSRALSGHPQGLHMPPAPKLPEGPWLWTGAATNTAFAGPWGVTFAANLTPDTSSGIGAWTEDMFVRSIRSGRHWGTGRQIMPPMPWPAYSHLNDDDIHAIYAYLRSLPPIVNEVPPYIPPGQTGAGE